MRVFRNVACRYVGVDEYGLRPNCRDSSEITRVLACVAAQVQPTRHKDNVERGRTSAHQRAERPITRLGQPGNAEVCDAAPHGGRSGVDSKVFREFPVSTGSLDCWPTVVNARVLLHLDDIISDMGPVRCEIPNCDFVG